MKKINILYFITFILLVSCAEPIYKTADYAQTAAKHQQIAILPPKVIIEIKNPKFADSKGNRKKLKASTFRNLWQNFWKKKELKEILPFQFKILKKPTVFYRKMASQV